MACRPQYTYTHTHVALQILRPKLFFRNLNFRALCFTVSNTVRSLSGSNCQDRDKTDTVDISVLTISDCNKEFRKTTSPGAGFTF